MQNPRDVQETGLSTSIAKLLVVLGRWSLAPDTEFPCIRIVRDPLSIIQAYALTVHGLRNIDTITGPAAKTVLSSKSKQ